MSVEERIAALEAEMEQIRHLLPLIEKANANAEWATNNAMLTQGKLNKLLDNLENVEIETGLRADRLAIKAASYMAKLDELEAKKSRRWDRLATAGAWASFTALLLFWMFRER